MKSDTIRQNEMKLEFRMLQEIDIGQCCRLFNSVFQRSVSDEYFLWKYFRNPYRKEIEAPKVVALADQKVVGMYCSIPVRFRYQGQMVPAAQPVDNCIYPEYRKYDTQRSLFRLFSSRGSEQISFIFGFPNASHLTVGRRLLGYRIIESRELFCLDLNQNRFGEKTSTLAITPINRFEPFIDTVWAAALVPNLLTAEKTHQSLNWRYVENPCGDFHSFILLKDGAVIGFTVLRRMASHDGVVSAQLYELALPSDMLISHILCPLGNALREFGYSKLYTHAGQGALTAGALIACGFTPIHGSSRTSVYKPFSTNWISPDLLADPRRWSLIQGDTDW